MVSILPEVDVEVLIALDEVHVGLGLSELARVTGRPTSSVQRSVMRLRGAKVVVRGGRQYRFAPLAPRAALLELAAWCITEDVRRIRAAARQEALRGSFKGAMRDKATAHALRAIARRYLWWEPPSVSLGRPERLVAQVMTDGTWEDTEVIGKVCGDLGFSALLDDPPPGVFDRRAWAYWHARLGRDPLPPLPRRAIA